MELADTNPFITTQDLADYMGRGDLMDPGMVIAVDAACDTVRAISGQQFNRGTTIYTLDGTGTDALLLPELPVNAAGTVSVDGEVITDYMLSANGILFRGTAGAVATDPWPVWPKGRQNVSVTADHGYETVEIPRDVRMVALSLAARIAIQGVAVEESRGSTRIKYGGPAMDLTSGERRILAKHRRPG